MLLKLKTEIKEFFLWKKILVLFIASSIVAYVHLNYFLQNWTGASIGEYIVYSLTECNYFLVLFPILCMLLINGKNNEVYRYPILLHYKTRNEYFYIRFMSRGIFLAIALLIHIGTLMIVGRFLPVQSQMIFVSSRNLMAIIIKQFLNIFCYVCVMALVHEILIGIFENVILDIMLTSIISLLNLLVVKLVIKSIVLWTPWGNIAYRLFGTENKNYQFYFFYWMFLILLLFYLAEELNGRKDYVFEETHKVN